MYLKKIKLAGFKSFVDPTTIPVTANMIGVVGPNGCGKSNIIDAVRWVMGESSARHLRGDSMADVIFSGSNSRKPVGTASVELVFDNTDGKAPGQYAAYAEISIRREASRDGQSQYYINKTKCRRKDITDLFLGTGLGPRTYSIIEQGMVTRIVESKPEELRGFLEEAAGISKYKERRRETENRIRHTRENLERVEDIRQELETQLKKLHRQSKAAARYKELKKQERLLRAQLIGLRWKRIQSRLQEIDSDLSRQQTGLEGLIADQRGIETRIETLRSEQADANEALNAVQERYYALGADISAIEQKIQHARDTHRQRLREQEQVNNAWQDATLHLETDRSALKQLDEALAASTPRLEAARGEHDQAAGRLRELEQALHDWQQTWQDFNTLAAEPEKTGEIQQARIQHLNQHLERLQERRSRLQAEDAQALEALEQEEPAALRAEVQALDERHAELERELEAVEQRIQQSRQLCDGLAQDLETRRGEYQSGQARLASLKELQEAAEGRHDEALGEWLKRHGLDRQPRLSSRVQVEPGWERAAERVLGEALAAVCVGDLEALTPSLESLDRSDLMLLAEQGGGAGEGESEPRRLSAKVRADADLSGFLHGVFVAETLTEAMGMRPRLAPGESVITPSGTWVGRHWISLANQEGARAGLLRRAQEMAALEPRLAALKQEIDEGQRQLETERTRIQDLEADRAQIRQDLSEHNRRRTEAHARLSHAEARTAQLKSRHERLQRELEELETQFRDYAESVAAAEALLEEARRQTGSHEARRRELQEQRATLLQQTEQARERVSQAREALHELEIERQRITTTRETTQQSIERLENQLGQLAARKHELERALAEEEDPESGLKEQLDALLKQRVDVEQKLGEARRRVAAQDEQMRELEQERARQEESVQEKRQLMEEVRMRRQEHSVRQETLKEQIAETGFELEQVLDELPAEATEEAWEEENEKVARRISRLGPINLVAIEEYEEQSERKSYLDKQYEDLTQALSTLEEVIRKIDRETRTRFKETFDRVNTGLQSFFPQLFGGGHAYLELTGDDLLDTGVTVMARPPGKRNSTIHLLSGGEKALTAVALVFSIFQLNPAPFCLLDEVDAPLDDANVGRYCETLKEMAKETQLLYVTHNKITMEVSELLLGVTMSEPGVSRLVAVDVDEAVEMVG